MFWWGGHFFDRSCGLSLDANRRWYASKAWFLFDWKGPCPVGLLLESTIGSEGELIASKVHCRSTVESEAGNHRLNIQ